MPENKSVSAWENEVKSCGAHLGVNISKSQVQKIAKRFHKLEAAEAQATTRTPEEMFELFKHIIYGDPTGDEAVRHVMNPDECGHHANVRQRLERKAA